MSWSAPPADDSSATQTSTLPIPEDRRGNEFEEKGSKSPIQLDKPSNVETEVELDPDLRNYTVNEKVGDIDYRPPSSMTFQEFAEYQRKRMIQEYWKSKSDEDNPKKDDQLAPPLFEIKRGGAPLVELRPSGFVTLDLGGRWQRVDNPAVPIRQQRTGGFEFDQQISLNLVGTIGERVKVNMNWDTKATFDFDNNIKISYEGKERDIVREIQAGNVSMPLNNSLIRGAQNLFGIKTKLQFGRLGITALVSNQRGKTDTEVFKAGAKSQTFDIQASEYDVNRHFFLSQFFRGRFNDAYKSNPTAPNSGLKVTRVEVWVTNLSSKTDQLRDFVGFTDLGENGPSTSTQGQYIFNKTVVQPKGNLFNPSNESNTLLDKVRASGVYRSSNDVVSYLRGIGLSLGKDFERVTSAQKLDEKDFTFNSDLGFLSLNTRLKDDQAIAVAYEYTFNGQSYRVGELTEDYQNLDPKEVIVLKMIKPQSLDNSIPTWDLMMKNVYRLNSSGIKRDNFRLKIIYKDDRTGIDNPSLQEGNNIKGVPLVQVLGMDKLNLNGDLIPDGNFDYIENATVVSRNGLVIFPVIEPFGSDLESEFYQRDPSSASQLTSKYTYPDLYDNTQNQARQKTSRNKYFLQGDYETTVVGDIRLKAFKVEEESVTITVGSITLQPGVDYTVTDGGQVKIMNEGALASGNDIIVKYESPEYFSFRTKSLVGTRLDYKFSEDFLVGGTIMHLNERPLLTRVNAGDEPVKNTQIGLDVNYKSESRVLTKMVDFLPVIQTKEKSNVALTWEGAMLKPGKNKLISREGGTSYIDDFDNTAPSTPLTNSGGGIWNIASTPRVLGNANREYADWSSDSLDFGYHRGKIAVYNVDRTFYTGGGGTSGVSLKPEEEENNYTRAVLPQEIYNRDIDQTVTTEDLLSVVYYPSERGPYNYNTNQNEIKPDGRFFQPESTWGGITRAITSETDFDNKNVEYIEFWMMDPFHNGADELAEVMPEYSEELANTPSADLGGDIYFNLGDISEDYIKDSRHGFENGLPLNVEETNWGKVTTEQFITSAFNNTVDRSSQDVGMDGLNSVEEVEQFSNKVLEIQDPYFDQSSPYVQKFISDPSTDNFKHYTEGDWLLDRYKDWQGEENNSPVNTGEGVTPASTTIPDNEDMNGDKTLNINDRYYQYHLNIAPDMSPENNKYIVERKQGTGTDVDWVLFRIPVKEDFRNIGGISGFQTIKFLRMYLTNFKVPVVLRLGQFRLVSSQWRKVSYADDNFSKQEVNNGGKLEISNVSIEENFAGVANVSSPYVLPPGIVRDQDQSSNVNRRLNEQSLKIAVTNMEGGYTKGAFKNMVQDLIFYKKFRVFIHAESVDQPIGGPSDLNGVVRLGTDNTENYYEIELPLTYSDVTTQNNDPNEVWRDENTVDIAIRDIVNVKVNRKKNGGSPLTPYSEQVGKYKVTVVGNPDVSAIRTAFLGVRNPNNPGEYRTANLWFNEMRVTDFDTETGYATTGMFTAQLADLGTFSATGKYVTAGYGDIETKVADRTRETSIQYGAATNLALDKFIPGKTGIQLPLYMSIDKQQVRPKYDPLNPDVYTEDALDAISDEDEKEEYKKKIVYNKTVKSINLTNVKKNKVKPDSKKHIYDIENVTVSAGYSEETRSGIGDESGLGNNLDEYKTQNYQGTLNYAYSPSVKPLEPFKKSKAFRSKHLRLVKDFNINFIPNSFSVTGNLDRTYTRTQLLNDDLTTAGVDPTYEKRFYFNRDYSLRWNLTKSINFSYTAGANALIDEPLGNKNGDPEQTQNGYVDSKQKYRDSIWTNIGNLGRMKNFDQSVNLTYKVPLSKIPALSWVNADAGYKGGYNWTAGAFGLADTLGHSLSNNQNISVNGKLNFLRLYNKSKYLKKINNPPRKRKSRKSSNSNAEPEKDNKLMKAGIRFLMMVRNVSGRYNLTHSIYSPGFLKTPRFFGVDQSGDNAPGYWFAFGGQDYDRLKNDYRTREGWYSQSAVQNQAMSQTRTENLDLKALVEPIKDFRINLTAKSKESRTWSEIYRYTDEGDFETQTPVISGNVSMSFMAINTSFKDPDQLFSQFESNRYVIQQRRADDGYSYDANSQEVLTPAFIAAYSGESAEKVKLSNKPKHMMPNWRIDYAGLSKIKAVRRRFSSVNISHGYVSTYDIGSYTTNLVYAQGGFGRETDIDEQGSEVSDSTGNTIPIFVLSQVAVSEKFSPLIGINVRTKSKISFRFDYNKSRTMDLNMANAQMTEIRSNDFVFGIGFTKSKMPFLGFKKEGQKIILQNDVTFKLDVSIRETETIQRTIEGQQTTTAGNWNFQLKPNINYKINQRVNLQMYFERTINEPKISSSYRRATTAFGFRLKFNLA